MHDIRNYMYSLQEIGFKLTKKHLNKSRKRDRYESMRTIDETNNIDISRSTVYEFDSIMKHVIHNISYIYHLDLIHDDSYQVKQSNISIKILTSEILDNIKILIDNLNLNLTIYFNVPNDVVQIDPIVFQYILCQMIKDVYENKIYVLFMYLDIFKSENYFYIDILIEFENHTKVPSIKIYSIKKMLETIYSKCNYSIETNQNSISLRFSSNNDYKNYFDSIMNQVFSKRISPDTSYEKLEIFNIYNNQNIVVQSESNYVPYIISHHSEDKNIIYINLDDELNILKMNKRVFKQESLSLNGVRTIKEFLELLKQIEKDHNSKTNRIQILALIDHMIDNERGNEAIYQANKFNQILGLNITYVLVSSTEDSETLKLYEELDLMQKVVKPLNRKKLKEVLDNFNNRSDIIKEFISSNIHYDSVVNRTSKLYDTY